MKFSKPLFITFLAGALALTSADLYAQRNWNRVTTDDATAVDTLTKKKYTLIFIDKSPDLNPQVKERLIDAFFTTYPKEAKLYNKNTTKKVIFIVDPEYKGVAAAGGGIVRFNPEWFKSNPGDIDVVTHEVMHLVQSYPGGAGPGWITEGIADYVRFKFGVDNEGGNWRLPEFRPEHHYTDAYRITARFFHWIEQSKKKGLVKKLDDAMRTKTYNDGFWLKETGMSIDDLWAAYAANPAI